MRRVIMESPFAGALSRNLTYARRALRDCILRGEAPFASHLLYTQKDVLDDTVHEERELGIAVGFEWKVVSDATVVYVDYGISQGMQRGVQYAQNMNHEVEYRTIGRNPDDEANP